VIYASINGFFKNGNALRKLNLCWSFRVIRLFYLAKELLFKYENYSDASLLQHEFQILFHTPVLTRLEIITCLLRVNGTLGDGDWFLPT